MVVRVEPKRKLRAEELMPLNCGVGEDSWESLGLQGIQPVHPKGNQSWVFIGRTDLEAETPILWPPDVKSWLIWNDSDAGKNWRQEEKERTEDEVVGWHHRLDGHEFEQALGDGEGQGTWRAAVRGVAKSWSRLNNWTTTSRKSRNWSKKEEELKINQSVGRENYRMKWERGRTMTGFSFL